MPSKTPTPPLDDKTAFLEEVDRDLAAQTEASPSKPHPGFAEQQGSNVLLLMGVVVFLMAWVSFFAGRTTLAAVLVTSSLVTVVIATGLARLEVLKLEIFKIFDFLARFRQRA